MDDEAMHISLGEVRRIIGRLRGPDLVRLSLLARAWAAAYATMIRMIFSTRRSTASCWGGGCGPAKSSFQHSFHR
ncbi:hypothetical protein CQ10_37675 [Bradyrhizobium valentinum]|nr:hypothetical protein CQ10_37675 [Bradyrhizobium valentinum]